MGAPNIRLAAIASLTTIVLWSFAFPASKAALPFFSVEQVVLTRYLVACGFYLVLFVLGKFPLPALRDIPLLFLLGLLGVTAYQLLFVFGMGLVAGGAAGLMVACNPVITSLLARIFLKERLGPLVWAGIVISAAGVAVISLSRGADGEPLGFLALLISTIAIAIFFTFQKPFFNRYSPLAMTSYTSFLGTLPLLIFLPETWQALQHAPIAPILWIVAMGVLSSGVGFLLWFYALSQMRAGIVTSFLFLQPILVAIMSWLWLGEIPGRSTIIGGTVALAGVALILQQQIFGKGSNRRKVREQR